jgi:Calcineurin-like phosphoesterase
MDVVVVSDIHFACPDETVRGDFQARVISNPLLRLGYRFYRRYLWLRDPFAHNHMLDAFLTRAGEPDLVIANGDYSCDSAFIGVSDSAACRSASCCLTRLREAFRGRFHASLGDHELGKMSLLGGAGGLRLNSWRVATQQLELPPLWQVQAGRYVLVGIVSSLVALPVFEPELLPEEKPEWERLRAQHLEEIREAFAAIEAGQRVLLFCHDPSALTFLLEEDWMKERIGLIEHTIIGHLHSPSIFWTGQALAGMPRLSFLGNTIRRYSTALREARCWNSFRVRLCPSLTGIQLFKDGGFLRITLDVDGTRPAMFEAVPLRWAG